MEEKIVTDNYDGRTLTKQPTYVDAQVPEVGLSWEFPLSRS